MKSVFLKIYFVAILGIVMSACNNDGTGSLGAEHNDTVSDNRMNNDTMRNDNNAYGTSNDRDFVRDIVESNYTEIEMAKTAQERSGNSEVKQIAKMLEEDHTAALNKLKNLTIAQSFTLPAGPGDGSTKDINKLRDEEQSKFDKKWCNELMERHNKGIERFEKEEKDVADSSLKKWIVETLPKLRTHHSKLTACYKKLK